MSSFKRLFHRIKNPHGWAFALFCIVALALIVGSVLLAILNSRSIFAFILYAFATVALVYLVYAIIYFVPIIRKKGKEIAKKTTFTDNFVNSYGYRSIVFLLGSFIINLAYAIFQGVLCVINVSVWCGALCVYYLVLCLIRGFIYAGHKIRKTVSADDIDYVDAQNYRQYGAFLLLISLALCGAVVQMIFSGNTFIYPGLTIYGCSLYAFYKIILSVYNMFKSRRMKYITIRAIKNISFSAALVSIFALQTALLEFADPNGNHLLANAITGGIVCAVIIVIGLSMIIVADIKLRRLKKLIK